MRRLARAVSIAIAWWGLTSGSIGGAQTCADLTNLSCDYDCRFASTDLTWANGAPYGSIVVERDGTPLVTLPGSATSFQDANVPPGRHTYRLFAVCSNGASTPLVTCAVEALVASENLIISTEGRDNSSMGSAVGAHDSALFLRDALVSSGVAATILRANVLGVDWMSDPCTAPLLAVANNVWVCSGNWPDDGRLSVAEGNALAAYANMGKNIYFEGNDHWGYNHVPSDFDAIDGIDQPAMDTTIGSGGDNSFTRMAPLNAPLAGMDATGLGQHEYVQDQTAADFTDRLLVAPEPGTTSSEPIWVNVDDTQTAEPIYFTGAISRTTGSGVVVIVASWEFGGFGDSVPPGTDAFQSRIDLATLYLSIFESQEEVRFTRGDVNVDAAVNIADAVFLLGHLFPGAGTPNVLQCGDAADANDDGTTNLADVIRILGSLFSIPAVPLPPPTTCAPDPTDPANCPISPCPAPGTG